MNPKLQQLQKYASALGIECFLKDNELFQKEYKRLPPGLRHIADLLPLHQLIAKGSFGKLSVINCGGSFDQFEIYCLDGDLFEGTRRYLTITDCGRVIYYLLTTGLFDENIPRAWDAFTDFLCADPDGSVQKVIPPELE